MDNLFSEDDIIHAYTRKEALEDGFQVDANVGDFAEVTKQHYRWPVFMSRARIQFDRASGQQPTLGQRLQGRLARHPDHEQDPLPRT